MSMVATPHRAELEQLVTGVGEPATVFAHGFACSIADTRPLGSAVAGSRVFFHSRGHGRSSAPSGSGPCGAWTYTDLSRDLRAVADLSGATRAVGASLGAGALCRLLADHPNRFERAVFFLPAALDELKSLPARSHCLSIIEAVEAGETAIVADLISREVPAALRQSPRTWEYLRQRLDHLMRHGLATELADLTDQVPVHDRADLRATTASALVIGCVGDEIHPVCVAERLCEALPDATLHVYDRPGVLWTHRADVRERISSFLNAE